MLWYSPSYKWRLALNSHVEDTCMTSYVYQGGGCRLIKLVLPQPYVTLAYCCYPVSALWVSSFHRLLAFTYFGFERTWWRFFQKRAMHTRYEIYVFISLYIEMTVSSLESDWSCMCILEVYILPLYLRFLIRYRNCLTLWYFMIFICLLPW